MRNPWYLSTINKVREIIIDNYLLLYSNTIGDTVLYIVYNSSHTFDKDYCFYKRVTCFAQLLIFSLIILRSCIYVCVCVCIYTMLLSLATPLVHTKYVEGPSSYYLHISLCIHIYFQKQPLEKWEGDGRGVWRVSIFYAACVQNWVWFSCSGFNLCIARGSNVKIW